jgi:hypothetical protein
MEVKEMVDSRVVEERERGNAGRTRTEKQRTQRSVAGSAREGLRGGMAAEAEAMAMAMSREEMERKVRRRLE